jgi:nitrous oxide reductase accessory protein NosL
MRSTRRSVFAILVATACVAAACSKKSDTSSQQPRTLTQAQRDSAIAASKLPGAGVVGKALEVADSAEARAEDSEP